MPRFAVEWLDVLCDLFRGELDPAVTVMTRIPDHLVDFLPLVVIRASGGDSLAPEFYDTPLVNVQCWTAPPDPSDAGAIDQYRAASNLADECRRILWTAYRTQQVVPGKGWINQIRESSGPRDVPDVDLPLLGRYVATYELRIRPAAA